MLNDASAMRRLSACLALCLILLAATQAGAASFSDCLAGLRGAAQAGGVDAATFDKAARGLTPNPDVLALA
ncbi:MAG: lytic murein transglycosylase, partial [Methylocella sp.]